MKKESKKKQMKRQSFVGTALFGILGFWLGASFVRFFESVSLSDVSLGMRTLVVAFSIITLPVALYFQLIIHEFGHFMFGLLTGYRFLSFRVFSFLWTIESGKLRFRRLSIAGTAGQCLLIPPESADENTPFVLYNLGGSLLNAAFGLLFLGLLALVDKGHYASYLLLVCGIIGLGYSVINGFPLRMGLVDNDGYNVLSIKKSKRALQDFVLQLKINEQLHKGARLRDLPDEWFKVPEPEEMNNSITAAIGGVACARLMDTHAFESAIILIEKLLNSDTDLIGLHRHLLICDRIYCELVGEMRQEKQFNEPDKQQKKFMKTMKSFPQVLRTEYVYALRAEKNEKKAAKVKASFESIARTYPYTGEIESERELINIADAAV